MKTNQRFRKFSEHENLDPMLKNWVIANSGTQTIILKSILQKTYSLETYPQMKERHEKIEIKPGRVKIIPHRYYTVHTRDDSPATFKELTMNEAIEIFPKKVIQQPDEL